MQKQEKEEAAGISRAARLREQIQKLREKSPEGASSGETSPPKSPREFTDEKARKARELSKEGRS